MEKELPYFLEKKERYLEPNYSSDITVLFLENVLTQSALARDAFDQFLSQSSSNQNLNFLIIKSLKAFDCCLEKLKNPPFEDYQEERISQFLVKALLWRERVSADDFIPTQKTIDRLSYQMAYFDLLQQLKKILNQLVNQHIPYTSNRKVWTALRKIHPIVLIWEDYFLLPMGKVKTFLIFGILMLGIIFLNIWYFFLPHAVNGILITYPNKDNFFPSPNRTPLIFEKASLQFQVTGNGKFQEIGVLVPKDNYNVERILFGFNLRIGWTLKLDSVQLLGKENKILKTIDFKTSEKEHWGISHLIRPVHFKIHSKGLAALEKINMNQKILNLLLSMEGKIFNTKEEFHTILDMIVPKPDWHNRALIRKAFRLPVYKQQGFSHRQLFFSPPMELKYVESVKFRIRIDPPFSDPFDF